MHPILHPVKPFSAPHIIIFAVLISCAVFLAFFLSRKSGFTKKVIWACAAIGFLCEMERMIFFMEKTINGFRLPPDFLPFNLCQFQVILIFILAFSENIHKKKLLLSFMYPSLTGGAFIGILIPAAVNFHGLFDIGLYRYFFFHAMLLFLGLYLFLTKPIQYTIKEYFTGFFFSFTTQIFGVWINAFFGWDPDVNHMFVVRPPLEGLPILNLNKGWPFYMLQMFWIGALLVTLCYLPVIIRDTAAFIKVIKEKQRR